MENLMVIGCLVSFLTGAIALWLGRWGHFTLKHAAMMLSTLTSLFFTLMLFFHPYISECTAGSMMCANWALYGLASNVRVILFHISLGRDAIRFKSQDRRGATGDVIRGKRAF